MCTKKGERGEKNKIYWRPLLSEAIDVSFVCDKRNVERKQKRPTTNNNGGFRDYIDSLGARLNAGSRRAPRSSRRAAAQVLHRHGRTAPHAGGTKLSMMGFRSFRYAHEGAGLTLLH